MGATVGTIALQNRNSSLDLIRLLAILMVCTIHVSGSCGYLEIPLHDGFVAKTSYNVALSLSVIAVNLFALLTGYLYVERAWNVKRLYSILIQSIAYFVVLNLVVMACLGNMVAPNWSNFYWYVKAYAGLFFCIPWLNFALLKLTERSHRLLLLVCFIVFSLLGTVMSNAYVGDGHNVTWLVVLYVAGAYLKRFPVKLKWNKVFAIWLVCTVSMLLILFLPEQLRLKTIFIRNYQSPFIFVSSLCMFQLLLTLKIRNPGFRRILAWMSPFAFGVYLFHSSAVGWDTMETFLPAFCRQFNNAWWCIPFISLSVFAVGIMVDFLRSKLFCLLRIPQLVNWLHTISPRFLRDMEQIEHKTTPEKL